MTNGCHPKSDAEDSREIKKPDEMIPRESDCPED